MQGIDVDGTSADIGREVYTGALGVVCDLFGTQSPLADTVRESNDRVMSSSQPFETRKYATLVTELLGVLRSLRADVEAGLVASNS